MRAIPPTTGGSTMGRVVSARTSRRPGKSIRARTQASGNPKMMHTAVAARDVWIESRRASRTSGSPRSAITSLHGARHSSPASGKTKNRPAMRAAPIARNGGRSRPRLVIGGAAYEAERKPYLARIV
jgi:hypothetical protein